MYEHHKNSKLYFKKGMLNFFNKVLLQNLTYIIDINDFGPFQFNHA